jgi:F5/8 type C domain
MLPQQSERAELLARRARLAATLAGAALAPSEPFEITAEAVASELYRQSVYWALCSFSAASDDDAGATYSESLWSTLDSPPVTQAFEQVERQDALRAALRAGSFVYFAELPQAERLPLSLELCRLAALLIAKLDERKLTLRRLYVQRVWRLGLLVALALAAVQGSLWLHEAREFRSDLALGKPWRASSKFGSDGCVTPEQECADGPGFFFHTNEEDNPWIEIDLGSEQAFSKVETENRKDCCSERAVPIVVETSQDHENWQLVSRRNAPFSTWWASFPTAHARWVRLRLPNHTYLHLSRVRIIP